MQNGEMMTIYLTDKEVKKLLPMDVCISLVESVFQSEYAGHAETLPRKRIVLEKGMFHVMGGASFGVGAVGLKTYATTSEGTKFFVYLFDAVNGSLLAIIEGGELSRIRTGAATGVAAKYLSEKKESVLGIIGANALGKTTMMKMIAGAEKPDSGSLDKKIKIAYKPQYLSNDVDVDVISVLNKANDGLIEGSEEEEQIVDPLKIKKLYNKSIKNLSGGELQKVSIVTCLLQKADLYALDEPSAFLDVEDRIAVAKFIQKFTRSYGKSAMVIDHDVQLLDLVSDSMVIFDGTSGVNGHASSPLPKVEAMNKFLRSLNITFRRDEKSQRPRVNKENSRLDKTQKAESNFYY